LPSFARQKGIRYENSKLKNNGFMLPAVVLS
jgi:hypothetical protein